MLGNPYQAALVDNCEKNFADRRIQWRPWNKKFSTNLSLSQDQGN